MHAPILYHSSAAYGSTINGQGALIIEGKEASYVVFRHHEAYFYEEKACFMDQKQGFLQFHPYFQEAL